MEHAWVPKSDFFGVTPQLQTINQNANVFVRLYQMQK